MPFYRDCKEPLLHFLQIEHLTAFLHTRAILRSLKVLRRWWRSRWREFNSLPFLLFPLLPFVVCPRRLFFLYPDFICLPFEGLGHVCAKNDPSIANKPSTKRHK
jgi:hypothetical protein